MAIVQTTVVASCWPRGKGVGHCTLLPFRNTELDQPQKKKKKKKKNFAVICPL
eukprot:NODE_1982_length_405_cov_64.651079_g1972_i0.p3 GENE.NODE_1982_length_405_cov_64.651079_g1972_i0~~NODE_1982_length_405_cov_64.651079_g1972_i0.p3  ORF type:complete len:53 (+),score=23.52 NODE_1982_length_405_cov_64.651079_g1972_i0:241-399(+)